MPKMREKVAQRMSTLQKVKEWGNVPRKVREWSSKNVYAPQMRKLRDVAGQVAQLEQQEFPSVRESIKLARRAFINGYYPSVMYYCNQVSKFVWKMWEIINGQLAELPESTVQNFFFQHPGVSKEQVSQIGASGYFDLVKEADVRDLWEGAVEMGWRAKNFFSQRRQEKEVMERLFPERAREMKKSAERVLLQAEGLFFDLKTGLREMGNAVVSGDINTYLKIANRLYQRQQNFNQDFVTQYQQNFSDMVGKLNDMDQEYQQVEPSDLIYDVGPEDIRETDQHPEYIAGEEK